MKIFVSVDANKVIGWGSTRGGENEIEIEIDSHHPFFSDNPFLYQYVDGELTKLPQEEIDAIVNKPKQPTDKERITQLESVILQMMMEG